MRHCFSLFMDQEIEAQRCLVTFQKSHIPVKVSRAVLLSFELYCSLCLVFHVQDTVLSMITKVQSNIDFVLSKLILQRKYLENVVADS